MNSLSKAVPSFGILIYCLLATGLFAQSNEHQASPGIKIIQFEEGTSPQGLLTVFTDPPGAKIYLNGERVDSSPLTLEVSTGKHRIRISSPGWVDEERLVLIEPDRKTVITALMRKPTPTEMVPADLGREYREELSFDDLEKEEIDLVYEKPQWPKTGKKASLLLMGVGAVIAMATVESKDFTEKTNTATQLSLAGLTLGMVGTVIFYVADEQSGSWVEKPIPENIEFNKKKRKEIEERNRSARQYNEETRRLLAEELAKRRKETDEFNKGRDVKVETY